MPIRNIHERVLAAGPGEAGRLLDSLASPRDALWPGGAWPPMRLDRPLEVGAAGGHGPVRYAVAAWDPGRRVVFRFTAPRGFCGTHAFEVLEGAPGGCLLRHTLEMQPRGPARITWPLVFRPLHDALLEDALAGAQAALGEAPQVRPWSPWVKALRWALSGGRARSQTLPRLPQEAP